MAEILNIRQKPIFDDSIEHYEYRTFKPYATSSYNNNDEIRITVQNQDSCVLPSRSFLRLSGRFYVEDVNNAMTAPERTKLVNLGLCHWFSELIYELNGVEIDRAKHMGLLSVIKGYLTLRPGDVHLLENAGWIHDDDVKLTDDNGYFDVRIPLKMLLGFAEDYQCVVVHAKHELILIRSNTDANAMLLDGAAERAKIRVDDLAWHLPITKQSEKQRLIDNKFLLSDPSLSIAFSQWVISKYQVLANTTFQQIYDHTAVSVEAPRQLIVVFQTDRENKLDKNASQFDHCNIKNLKLTLNGISYPYSDMNLNMRNNQYSLAYDNFANFQVSHNRKHPQPLISKSEFKDIAPIYVVDCSYQKTCLKSGPIDVRIEFESTEPFPANTVVYCVIVHDKIVEYKPISGTVRKVT